jgi:hypothetical protein
MNWLKAGLVTVGVLLLFRGVPVAALEAVPYVPKPPSPLQITGYATTGPRLEYLQLYNPQDMPVDISGWRVEYMLSDQAAPVEAATLQGWVKPGNYVLAGDASLSPDFAYQLSLPPGESGNVKAVYVVSPAYADTAAQVKYGNTCPADNPETNYWQRHASESTGSFTSTFDCFTPDSSYQLYGGGLYDFPATTPLRITEILSNPRPCSPLADDASCVDYVKFYNPTSRPVDLSYFRLRVGYQGQADTASNAYPLAGTVPPGGYLAVTMDADERQVSLTSTGSFVWLEDTYGIKKYPGTVQSYPDASATSKKGAAWAYDAHAGIWKWTAQPTPGNQPSVFVTLPTKTTKPAASTQPKPCKAGQYRSAETNRCRSLATASSSGLTPCKAGQTRNPQTNRCRSVATTASTRKPCEAGQERNPETNRCRKKAATIPAAAFAVEPAKETGKAFVGWWALGGVGALAAGYGVWEWRREMMSGVRKIGSFVSGNK